LKRGINLEMILQGPVSGVQVKLSRTDKVPDIENWFTRMSM